MASRFRLLNGFNLTVRVETPDFTTSELDATGAELLQKAISRIEMIAYKSKNKDKHCPVLSPDVSDPIDLAVTVSCDESNRITITPKTQKIERVTLNGEGLRTVDNHTDGIIAMYGAFTLAIAYSNKEP